MHTTLTVRGPGATHLLLQFCPVCLCSVLELFLLVSWNYLNKYITLVGDLLMLRLFYKTY